MIGVLLMALATLSAPSVDREGMRQLRDVLRSCGPLSPALPGLQLLLDAQGRVAAVNLVPRTAELEPLRACLERGARGVVVAEPGTRAISYPPTDRPAPHPLPPIPLQPIRDRDLCPAIPGDPPKTPCIDVRGERIEVPSIRWSSRGRRSTPHRSAGPTLDALAAVLKRHPQALRVRVEAHDDPRRGGDRYGICTSCRRARAIVDALAARGVPRARLVDQGFGATRPLADPRDPASSAINRRIEIRIEAWGEPPERARDGADDDAGTKEKSPAPRDQGE